MIWVRLCVIAAFFVSPYVAAAATLYMDPASSTISRGDSLSVNVRLDTDEAAEECVNAVSGVITYSDSIQPVDVSRGQSIFSIWVEEPVIDEVAKTISFAGGIPNGYCGRIQGDPRLTNTILTLVFRSPGLQIGGGEARQRGTISFTDDTAVYLNDGQGTRQTPVTYGTSITLRDSAGSGISDAWLEAVAADTTPPQSFSISLERDDVAFTGKYFIVFNTTDKETGIDHYEVLEESLYGLPDFNWGGTDAPWITARSPYVLKDQSLNSTIRVRAVDKAGNEYVAVLVPDESIRGERSLQQSVPMMLIGAMLLALIAAAGIFGFALYRRRNPKVVTDQLEN